MVNLQKDCIRLNLNFWRTFCVGQTQSTIASTNFCYSQLLIQFIVNNTVEFYLSFFCICVLAFVCLGFVVNNISYIPIETNFVRFSI